MQKAAPAAMPRQIPTDSPFKPKNKQKRQELHIRTKKSKETAKRDFRLSRKREEAKNPKLRIERHRKNVPITIDQKRRWDEIDEGDEAGTGIGKAVDVAALKRRRIDQEMLDGAEGRGEKVEKQGLTEDKLWEKDERDAAVAAEDSDEDDFTGFDEDDEAVSHKEPVRPESAHHSKGENSEAGSDPESQASQDDLESLLEDSSADEAEGDTDPSTKETQATTASDQASNPASGASSYLSLIPDALASKFPSLFRTPTSDPKILLTTSLNASIHNEATTLANLFPNCTYVPRQRHRYKSHHFSLREISKFASNREFTTLLVLEQDLKKPSALTCIHLPKGPTLRFSISKWIPGKALPGHGRPTEHHPELILNGFRTPLGLLTAHFFKSLFPPRPELQGRQVVTVHCQRDYLFLRHHRYIFRERREHEKPTTDPQTGEKVPGMQEVKAGLQELGPRMTLRLRRVDKGIQRASGQEWQWKSRMDKERTKFQL